MAQPLIHNYFYMTQTICGFISNYSSTQIYNNSASFGFGGGQCESVEGGGLFSDDGPFNASLQLNEEQYLVVFTSFQLNALSSMSVDVHGLNSISLVYVTELLWFNSNGSINFIFGKKKVSFCSKINQETI